MTTGIKYDQGKLKFSLLKYNAFMEMLKVVNYGANKYSPDNWKMLENSKERYFDAANRHLWAWWSGERYDAESKLHHLAHAMSSLLFIIEMDKLEESTQPQKELELVFNSGPHGY